MPVSADDLDGAITLHQLAAKINRSYRTAQRMVANGEIASIRVGSGRGGRVLITQRALNDYLNRHHRKAQPGGADANQRQTAGAA